MSLRSRGMVPQSMLTRNSHPTSPHTSIVSQSTHQQWESPTNSTSGVTSFGGFNPNEAQLEVIEKLWKYKFDEKRPGKMSLVVCVKCARVGPFISSQEIGRYVSHPSNSPINTDDGAQVFLQPRRERNRASQNPTPDTSPTRDAARELRRRPVPAARRDDHFDASVW